MCKLVPLAVTERFLGARPEQRPKPGNVSVVWDGISSRCSECFDIAIEICQRGNGHAVGECAGRADLSEVPS